MLIFKALLPQNGLLWVGFSTCNETNVSILKAISWRGCTENVTGKYYTIANGCYSKHYWTRNDCSRADSCWVYEAIRAIMKFQCRISNALHEGSMVWRVQNEPNELKKCTEIQAETRNIKTKQLFNCILERQIALVISQFEQKIRKLCRNWFLGITIHTTSSQFEASSQGRFHEMMNIFNFHTHFCKGSMRSQ